MKLTSETQDVAKQNVSMLKSISPDVFTEGKIDFDKLRQVLGDYIDDSPERYNFTWNGKGQALRLAQTPTSATLRPCVAESKDWDSTQNLYIEGDNLEVLKLLQKSYHGKVKMIYIDPPYNTGNDFVYEDNFSDSVKHYKEVTGQVDSEGKAISTNSEANGRFHTDWLNMMYPRLRLARNLLSDEGVIFISVDDNEDANLKKLCDEVFGESNFIVQNIWQKRTSPDARKKLSSGHEYILMYCKTNEMLDDAITLLPLSENDEQNYKNPDNDPRGRWVSSDFTAQGYRPNQMYKIITPNGAEYYPPSGTCWKNVEELYLQQAKEGRFWYGNDGKGMPRRKTYLAEKQGRNLWTWWPNSEVGHTQEATKELKNIFPDTAPVFDFPKPIRLIERMLSITTNDNDIILDFFSGSATTAHAVMKLNAEDGGKRRFIMVQLPEPCDEKSEAFKAGYKNICEIGKERIRRAGAKIKSDSPLTTGDLDVGFKVFKLDSSNIRKWNPNAADLEGSLFASVENYVDGRTEDDVVYEIMIKMGVDISQQVETREIAGRKVYSLGAGALMICLDDGITTDVANGMAALRDELGTELDAWRVVFRDNGFASDSAKTNAKEILKCAGLKEEAFLTI